MTQREKDVAGQDQEAKMGPWELFLRQTAYDERSSRLSLELPVSPYPGHYTIS